MRIWSNDFEHEGNIPKQLTCDDRDTSPHLAWDGIPEGTKSLALIVDDPDAPVGTWVHWLVCDIPPEVKEIPQGTVPPGARQVTNNFGKVEYGGPCPPSGTHRYFHKLYALPVKNLQGAANISNFYRLVEGMKIGEAVLMGTYERGRW
jgi:Raf kinase inhibitor-like YbhB/YbcL family protein